MISPPVEGRQSVSFPLHSCPKGSLESVLGCLARAGIRRVFKRLGVRSRCSFLGTLSTLVIVWLLMPLLVGGGPRTLLPGGRVFRWNRSQPVRYLMDKDLSNPEWAGIADIVRESFLKWEAVSTASLQIENTDPGFLDQDVTVSNFGAITSLTRPENPIIFDADGSIIDSLLGAGSSDTVLGFSGIIASNSQTLNYIYGFALLNGLQTEQAARFSSVTLHEIGHLLGLDHTQSGRAMAGGLLADNHLVPVMYPFAQLFGPDAPLRDDVAWFSWLYPEEDFGATTGTIKGTISRPTGTPVEGANVVAVQVSLGADESVLESSEEMVSVVSDFLLTGDGSYELPGLSPGQYVVFIEPLDPAFVGGSSVGPFDTRFTNFPKDYYNGEGESGFLDDDPTQMVVVDVGAGETLTGINLILNEPVNQLDLLEDDGEMLFTFQEGFSFPFLGKSYTEVVVNSDGNLTFSGGDSQPGVARSEGRFLSGPPRIAPLFTDLDPERDGQIEASFGTGSVTLTWEVVPEYSNSDPRPGNSFSVTLFSNGDILFEYDQVEVTADPNGVQAIVGITPGRAGTSHPTDLSFGSSAVAFEGQGVYEVFTESTFDLEGKRILFQASSQEWLFPLYRGDREVFSGYAMANLSPSDGVVLVEGFTPAGEPLGFPGNPHIESVGRDQQLAKLGSEFFEVSSDTRQEGWIRVKSSTPELTSFFQFGNGLSGPLTKMDGSVAWREQSKLFYFTRIYEGPDSFPALEDSQDARTFLSIANPNEEGITLSLTFFDPTGQAMGDVLTRQLPPNGLLFDSVATLFGLQLPVSDGSVMVEVVAGPGAIGFELIELSDTVLGLNASVRGEANRLYSAQLANGLDLDTGTSFFTSLKLLNVSDQPRAATVIAYREDGVIVGIAGPLTLAPRQAFQRDANQMFPLGSSMGGLIVGSIEVQVDGPGILGDVVFGDPKRIKFAAAIPLQQTLYTKAVFSQVANGSVEPLDLASDMFSGIAVFNPNDEAVQVVLRVFSAAGLGRGEKQFVLGKNQRLSDIIENLIPESGGLNGGYIILEASQGVVAQELFGNHGMDFLSAVLPVVQE